MLKMMIVGATSAIAHETARHFAKDGATFFLVARNETKLNAVADDLTAYGAASTHCVVQDMNAMDQHERLFAQAVMDLDGLDVLFIAHGTLGDQPHCETDFDAALQEINTNFASTASLLTIAANHFEKERRGVIAVVSSVAGDRGRATNYVYGTAMAAKTAFLSGLRNRLATSGVQVVTIKPGLVATPMTAGMPQSALFASAEKVGADIYKGLKQGRDVIYTPFFWRYIMLIIRAMPEPIFKRLKL